MYRKVTVVSIIVLVLSLAFASAAFAQTDTTSQNNQANGQGNNGQGSSPGNAFNSLGNGSRNLRANEQQWFAFQYAGDNSPIQIRLTGSNMQFSVWTQQDLANSAGNFGATANPVGRSTANSQFDGDQYWTGSFNTPGTYYVMVENANGGQGGNFTLSITGSGVSFKGNQGNNANSNNNNSSNNQSGSTSTAGGNTSGSTSNNTSGTSSSSASMPATLPRTGGEMASVLPMLIGAMGALSVTAGALLRRKK